MHDAIGFDDQGRALPLSQVTKWLILNGNTFVWLNRKNRPYKIQGDHSGRLCRSVFLQDALVDTESPGSM